MHYCLRHMEEPSAAQCRSCRGTYCARCLVYSFGPRKPPFCVGCALHASGVRSGQRNQARLDPMAGGPAGDLEVSSGGYAMPAEPKGWRANRAQKKAQRDAGRAVHHALNVPGIGGLPVEPHVGEDPFEAAVFEPLAAPGLTDDGGEAPAPPPSQLQLSGPRGSNYAADPYDL